MKYYYYTVNENGRKEIEKILMNWHVIYQKLGFIPEDVIDDYVRDVERSLAEGNGPGFEISHLSDIRGVTSYFSLSEDSLDVHEEIDDEDEEIRCSEPIDFP